MTPSPAFDDPARQTELRHWLARLSPAPRLETLQLAAADASPRRYWRLQQADGSSCIAMDAPPQHNELQPFLDVQQRLLQAGLRAPVLLAAAAEQGFLLLEDLGEQTLLPALQAAQQLPDPGRADRLMRAAIDSLVQLQARARHDGLPAYVPQAFDEELQRFPDWCVAREHGCHWGEREQAYWQQLRTQLLAAFAAQPQVLVHRDFMPRNLMLGRDEAQAPGLLDFQDAVVGPAGYDIAALLRDAFISWDEEQELDWAIRYWEAARRAGIPWSADFGECWRAIEFTALHRHLHVLGVFCRLKHRDGKERYAADLPRFFAYAVKTATRYRELSPLRPLLEQLRPGITQQAYG